MTTLLNNRSENTALFIRKGGPGNKWTLFDDGGAQLDAFSGGGRAVEQRFGLDGFGNRVYLGAVQTGDKEPITSTIMFRPDLDRLVAQLKQGNCPFDVMGQYRCDDLAPTNYLKALLGYDGQVTSKTYDNPLVGFAADAQGADIMRSLETTFAPIEDALAKLVHKDISGSVSDMPFNKIISVGREACIGDCATSEDSGENDFWAVTDQDSTPGHAGSAAPRFWYTEDGGLTWNASTIDDFTLGDATGVAKAGEYVIVCSPTKGIAYARFEDIKNGVALPWTMAGTWATNFPNDVFMVSASVGFACGTGGYIWMTTDGGLTWTAISAGAQTTQALRAISFADSTTGYFVGDGGAVVQFYGTSDNYTLSLIAVRTAVGGAAVTANLTSVAARPGKGSDVLVGTATGLIYRSQNARSSYPLFTNMSFDRSGSGSIKDLKFAGFRGSVLFIVQQAATGAARVLRDISGGALGNQVEVVGAFDSPGNLGINSIAPANINMFVSVGESHESFAFIGKGVAA